MAESWSPVPSPMSLNSPFEPIVRENVAPNSIISADEWDSYNDLKHGYELGRVNHSKKEWKVGIHHTNTIEGHWSHFKRAVASTHIHISSKHMWKYVAEFSYRRNYRTSHSVMFDRLVAAFALPRLQES